MWLEHPDYKDMKAEVANEKSCCLLSNGGFFTERGRKIVRQLGITDAEGFKKLARDNMHFKHQLGVIYVSTSNKDPEKRDLQPSSP
jgi:hypothetical protein